MFVMVSLISTAFLNNWTKSKKVIRTRPKSHPKMNCKNQEWNTLYKDTILLMNPWRLKALYIRFVARPIQVTMWCKSFGEWLSWEVVKLILKPRINLRSIRKWCPNFFSIFGPPFHPWPVFYFFYSLMSKFQEPPPPFGLHLWMVPHFCEKSASDEWGYISPKEMDPSYQATWYI